MDEDEFEKKYNAPDLEEFVDDTDDQEELLMRQDILDAMSLLAKVKTLLDYVGNVELCKSVTKRERETMAKVSEEVGEYLDAVQVNYGEIEDTE